jgi:hypothetical protein
MGGENSAKEEVMPKRLEQKLKRIARKRGYSKERTGAYVYGNSVMQEYARKKRARRKRH